MIWDSFTGIRSNFDIPVPMRVLEIYICFRIISKLNNTLVPIGSSDFSLT